MSLTTTENMTSDISSEKNLTTDFHPLSDKWSLYAHLPHDTDWSINSYKQILEFNYLEHGITLFEAIPEKMTQNCMLFLMKNDIKPTWEDPENRNGGSFSFKVAIHDVHECWRDLCYLIIGESITNDKDFLKNINGVTISPKRNFCIIKIWTKDSGISTLANLVGISKLNVKEVQFKKHNPIN